MKHFIGGWALGVILVAWFVLFKTKNDLLDGILAGLLTGWIVGLAVWGLWP